MNKPTGEVFIFASEGVDGFFFVVQLNFELKRFVGVRARFFLIQLCL